MKLEKFKKMNNQKKIIIGSIIGILLILGSVFLYRSYALYEEEKEFNVLRGKVSDFGYDIKMLSVVVDGEKSKTIPSRGLYKTQIDCSNGTRGEWDYNAWNLTLENVSENARCNITFTSNLTEEEYDKYIEAGKALRRNTYRGKDITSYHEDGSLYEMISSGRFDDIYVGDYIKSIVNGKEVTWLIADIDNYLYSGSMLLTKHHLTIIPAVPLMNASMNDTDTAEGGYLESKMKQSTLPTILSTYVEPAFNGHILSYNAIFTSAISTTESSMAGAGFKGSSNGWLWNDSKIDLMSEANVYGMNVASSSVYDTGVDNMQYAIFQLKPNLVNSYGLITFDYWLKGVSSATGFLRMFYSNVIIDELASNSLGVRPRFLIG